MKKTVKNIILSIIFYVISGIILDYISGLILLNMNLDNDEYINAIHALSLILVCIVSIICWNKLWCFNGTKFRINAIKICCIFTGAVITYLSYWVTFFCEWCLVMSKMG